MQLKIVVFPVFVRPMMPQLRAIIESFFDFKKGRAKLKILASSEKKWTLLAANSILYYFCSRFDWWNQFVQWCNGSTADFGSACLGSNPGWTTIKHKTLYQRVLCFKSPDAWKENIFLPIGLWLNKMLYICSVLRGKEKLGGWSPFFIENRKCWKENKLNGGLKRF